MQYYFIVAASQPATMNLIAGFEKKRYFYVITLLNIINIHLRPSFKSKNVTKSATSQSPKSPTKFEVSLFCRLVVDLSNVAFPKDLFVFFSKLSFVHCLKVVSFVLFVQLSMSYLIIHSKKSPMCCLTCIEHTSER